MSSIETRKKIPVKAYLIFLVGLFINSFGVSFITKASLGTSPISSIPYVLSLGFPFSLGQFTFVFNLLLVAMQLGILRKKFKKSSWLQIPVTLLFSAFIDLTMYLLAFMKPESYLLKMISLLIGCLILGFGVYVEVLANVVMLPGESFVNAVSQTWHTDFGKTKVIFDSSMALIAALLSFLLFHTLNGVREGTVIAALLVGMIARFCQRKLAFLSPKIFPERAKILLDETTHTPAANRLVITISREYGSCGRTIGQLVAKELGMDFYDREIIAMAAKESSLSEEYIAKNEQRLEHSLLQDLVGQNTLYDSLGEPKDRIYTSTLHAIQNIAESGNCVIVGRCADYILRGRKNGFHIFLYADDETKTTEIMKRTGLPHDAARRHMTDINKERIKHYKYYTGRIFGLASNYHLLADTGKLGVDETVRLICDAVQSTKNK